MLISRINKVHHDRASPCFTKPFPGPLFLPCSSTFPMAILPLFLFRQTQDSAEDVRLLFVQRAGEEREAVSVLAVDADLDFFFISHKTSNMTTLASFIRLVATRGI